MKGNYSEACSLSISNYGGGEDIFSSHAFERHLVIHFAQHQSNMKYQVFAHIREHQRDMRLSPRFIFCTKLLLKHTRDLVHANGCALLHFWWSNNNNSLGIFYSDLRETYIWWWYQTHGSEQQKLRLFTTLVMPSFASEKSFPVLLNAHTSTFICKYLYTFIVQRRGQKFRRLQCLLHPNSAVQNKDSIKKGFGETQALYSKAW